MQYSHGPTKHYQGNGKHKLRVASACTSKRRRSVLCVTGREGLLGIMDMKCYLTLTEGVTVEQFRHLRQVSADLEFYTLNEIHLREVREDNWH